MYVVLMSTDSWTADKAKAATIALILVLWHGVGSWVQALLRVESIGMSSSAQLSKHCFNNSCEFSCLEELPAGKLFVQNSVDHNWGTEVTNAICRCQSLSGQLQSDLRHFWIFSHYNPPTDGWSFPLQPKSNERPGLGRYFEKVSKDTDTVLTEVHIY